MKRKRSEPSFNDLLKNVRRDRKLNIYEELITLFLNKPKRKRSQNQKSRQSFLAGCSCRGCATIIFLLIIIFFAVSILIQR